MAIDAVRARVDTGQLRLERTEPLRREVGDDRFDLAPILGARLLDEIPVVRLRERDDGVTGGPQLLDVVRGVVDRRSA